MEEKKNPGDKPKRASRKKTTTTGDDANVTQFTPNPEGANKSNEVIEVEAEPVTIEVEIKNQIAKFNIAEAGIEALKQQYGGLTIPDGDKEAYEAVKKAWNTVRSTRTGLEKKGLELRNNYTVITKAIKGEEDRLVKLLSPLEEDLQKKWKAVDEAKEAEKQRKQKEEEDRLNGRLQQLQDLGMIMNAGFYTMGDSVSMDVATLRLLPDDQFEKFLGVVKVKAEELADIKRKQEEEQAEQQRQFQEQQRQLQEQQQQLREQQQQMQQQQQELQRQREQADKMRRELREQSLVGLGFIKMMAGVYQFKTAIMVEPLIAEALKKGDDLLDVPAEEFDEIMAYLRDQVVSENQRYNEHLAEQQRQKEAREKREAEIVEDLTARGMLYDANTRTFSFYLEAGTLTHRMNELLNIDEAEYKEMLVQTMERIAEIKDLQLAADNKKKAEQEAEAERQEAERRSLLSDRERLEEMLNLAQKHVNAAIQVNELKTDEIRDVATELLETINKAINKQLGINAGN